MIEIPKISTKPGTYILFFQLTYTEEIEIGKLGNYCFSPGFYLYVGSGFGPGGLRARIGRHIRKEKQIHWHVDYLISKADILEIWYLTKKERQECFIANLFHTSRGFICSVPKFGSSDCDCVSHLFYSFKKPSVLKINSLIKTNLKQLVIQTIMCIMKLFSSGIVAGVLG